MKHFYHSTIRKKKEDIIMILKTKRGKNVLTGTEKRIVFPINAEGNNDFCFASNIARKFWPELLYMGDLKVGTVLTKEVDDIGITFFAICCYSLEKGWEHKQDVIRQCFDSIPGTEPVATIDIGSDWLSKSTGANLSQIRAGMQTSQKEIVLYLS